MIFEVGHVPDGDPLDGKRLPVGMAEPTGELPQIVADRPAGVGCQIMSGEVLTGEPIFLRPDREILENNITPILFWFLT